MRIEKGGGLHRLNLVEIFEEVAHLFLLGAEIALESLLRYDFGGDALGDSDACGFECGDFVGVIGDEADTGDAHEVEDCGRHFVGAAIGGVAQFLISLDGVAAMVLQFVGAELGHEADPAAFLLLVEKDACASFADFFERELQLEAAVAAEGTEDVAGEALRVNADERRRGVDVTHDESNEALNRGLRGGLRRGCIRTAGLRCGEPALKAEDAEVSPARREIGLGDFLNAFQRHTCILRRDMLVHLTRGAERWTPPSESRSRSGCMARDVEIRIAEETAAFAVARALFEEYWMSFGFAPCFQNFGEEVAGLPGRYAMPDGRLAVAWVEDEPAACVALRRLDERRGEFKRLYVRPAFRGQRLGRRLVEWVMTEARAAGYAELVADTMPVMREALALYEQMGFERTEPYADQAKTGAVCIRKVL